MYGLGQSLQENGASFDAYSVGGRANLEALQQTLSSMVTASAGDSTALATMIAGLMQSLASYGVDAVGQLGFVQQKDGLGSNWLGIKTLNRLQEDNPP